LGSVQATIRALSQALLAGPWTEEGLTDRAARALTGGPPAPATLASRLIAAFGEGCAPHPRKLQHAIRNDPDFREVWLRRDKTPMRVRFVLDSPVMESTPGDMEAGLPPIPTTGDLARWLSIGFGELDWLADTWSNRNRSNGGSLRHYRYAWRPRENAPPRLIEMPKSRLKRVQRRILRRILDSVPLHAAAHGFRQGHSCLSYAQPHASSAVVARMDLRDFFQSINDRRVMGLFRNLGYPYAVARTLSGLCTHAVSGSVLVKQRPRLEWERRKRLETPHLPQGAPSSPALANLCAYRLDCRLAGLADKLVLTYTRYADDLAFSGNASLARSFECFHVLVARIALEEGFELNTRKTRLMKQSGRQRLTGIVINRWPNLQRADYDRLKALLYNCVRFGPGSQNRNGHPDFRAYLTGIVAHVEHLNSQRAARLRALFDRIDWDS
jgi:hypothetical protein